MNIKKNILKFIRFNNFKVIFILLLKIIVIYILIYIIKNRKLSFKKLFIEFNYLILF